ncbi:MAG: DUF1302 domain-containing protein [Gammaproteobacteria bacterium]|nr:DUF1302 domain-containing protein [Rhodocyclaceae bacterium]MBU3909878.1 DUF1302 domain-containing protein [Gammaproteobacteria bacterium]MBU3988872.1 DUF1302 domain-containing protein [Gammaproteobacteria bacterium]MBU4003543.1 DUF1302 domain-containing protein [Gammaproteobacteria bacterium]MBU4020098.1 DUF1302 domain-containing protein [Gammaproteobacteria bacterium]
MRQESGSSLAPQFRHSKIGTAIALALMVGAPSAFAFEFKSGEVTGSFDTTVSAGALWRMDKRDPTLVSIANGGSSRDPNSDDGNLKYDRGDLVSTLFKATHDLELKYRNFGAFVRASYFYDATISDKGNLNSKARDVLGNDAEILDAYLRGSFDIGGRNLNLRLGKQVVSWGESTFIHNGINVLNPVNVSRLRAPGSELKEGFIPTMMAYASQEITDNVSVEVALPAEWKKTKIDPAGSFFSTNDFVAEGGNIAYTGYGRRNDLNGSLGIFGVDSTAALWAPRSADREASDSGQYGVALRYFLPEFNNTELGFYHANYHSRTPYVSGYRGGITAAATPIPTCTVFDAPTATVAGLAAGCAFAAGRAGTYFVEYPEDIKLFGVSINTALPGGVALQGEYSYRKNQPMQLPSAELLNAALGAASQLTTTDPTAARLYHAYGAEISGYRRVKMHQIQFTGTKAFGPTFGAEQLVTVGEVGYTYLDLPSNLKFAAPGCHLPQPGSSTSASFGSTSTDCFATKNSWGYRLVGRLDYPNALGGATVSPRIAFSHDVDGSGPTFNEGAKAITLGVGFNYRQNWQADIAYTAFFGGKTESGIDPVGGLPYASSTNPMKDRDFLAISLSYSF